MTDIEDEDLEECQCGLDTCLRCSPGGYGGELDEDPFIRGLAARTSPGRPSQIGAEDEAVAKARELYDAFRGSLPQVGPYATTNDLLDGTPTIQPWEDIADDLLGRRWVAVARHVLGIDGASNVTVHRREEGPRPPGAHASAGLTVRRSRAAMAVEDARADNLLDLEERLGFEEVPPTSHSTDGGPS